MRSNEGLISFSKCLDVIELLERKIRQEQILFKLVSEMLGCKINHQEKTLHKVHRYG